MDWTEHVSTRIGFHEIESWVKLQVVTFIDKKELPSTISFRVGALSFPEDDGTQFDILSVMFYQVFYSAPWQIFMNWRLQIISRYLRGEQTNVTNSEVILLLWSFELGRRIYFWAASTWMTEPDKFHVVHCVIHDGNWWDLIQKQLAECIPALSRKGQNRYFLSYDTTCHRCIKWLGRRVCQWCVLMSI